MQKFIKILRALGNNAKDSELLKTVFTLINQLLAFDNCKVRW